MFPAQVVGQVYNLLAGSFGIQDGLLWHFLLRLLACVGGTAVHLNAVFPENIKANDLPDIPKLDIVVAVDDICFHLHLLAIHIDRVLAMLCHDASGISCGSTEQRHANKDSGKKV